MRRADIKKHISYNRIEDFNLFIMPAFPAWFVLSDEEAIAFHIFLDSNDREEALNHLSHELNIDYVGASRIYDSMLKVLETRKIYPDSPTAKLAPDAGAYPTNIHLALTHRCNLRCRHCYISAGDELGDEMSLQDWKEGFKRLFEVVPSPEITISGGEPTVIDYLPDLVSFLRRYAGKIVLYTNAMKEVGPVVDLLDEIQISLEGLSPDTHDFIRGRGAYSNVESFISSFPDASKLKIALTIMAHNFEEVKRDINSWMQHHDLDSSNMRFNAELEVEGRARDMPKRHKNFLYENALDVFEFIAEQSKQDYNQLSIPFTNMRNCGIGISLGIDSNGDIFPCDVFANKLGNLLYSDLQAIIRKGIAINEETEVDLMSKCSACDLRYICLGGCKAKNLMLNASYLDPICNEATKRIKYAQLIYDVGL